MKKFRVGYCEHGNDCLGCHPDEWRLLDEVYDTREEAIEALKQDMETYKGQWGENADGVEVDGWKIVVQDDILDAWCEWDIIETKS